VPDQIVPRLAHAGIAIINKVPMRADTLRQLPQLKMIAVAATGYDVVDIPIAMSTALPSPISATMRAHGAGTCLRHDSGAAAQSARVSQDVENGVWNKSSSSAFSRTTSAICMAPRSASSAKAPSPEHGGDRRLSHAGAVCRSPAPKMEGVTFTPHDRCSPNRM